jgi:multisubunit Na+/H+ antiporter MnhG subunit
MTIHTITTDAMLGGVVLSTWTGAAGMWRMKQPIQALHYISIPASIGIILLSIAVFVQAGNSEASWKTLLIAMVVLGINAVVGHATGRALRAREVGHWEPLDGDPIEFVSATEGK